MMKFADIPRVEFFSQLTPVEHFSRLSAFLGGPQIFVKRDDLGLLAMGGNKLRKLEYLMGDARDKGCDIVLTAGALQSNHARLTAAAAAKLGVDCHLVLKDEVADRAPAYFTSANIFLDGLLGAQIETVDADTKIVDALASRAQSYLKAGRKPYIIPVGGSNAVGSLGYVRCAEEIARQRLDGRDFDHIYVTSGSGGTHAGLLVGLALTGVSSKLSGVAISRSAAEQSMLVSDLVRTTAVLAGVDVDDLENAIHIDDGFYLPGYGQPNLAMVEAVSLCARLEGVLLDPVYTGKTMAALIGAIRSGAIGADENVLFVHTGGSPALFVYEEEFRKTDARR